MTTQPHVAEGPTRGEWDEISRRLQEPFDAKDVDFRVQGKATDSGRAQVVAYVDARVVQDRLDQVVGPGNWSFDWTPIVIGNNEVMIAKGTLTVHGVSKSDAGSASNFEQSLGAVSHCFKRAAVHWGVGRYLYSLPMSWVPVEKAGRISEAVLQELRARLPKPSIKNSADQMDEGDRVVDSPVDRRNRQQAFSSGPRAANPQAPVREVSATYAGAASEETSATEKQMASIRKLCEALGKPEPPAEVSYLRAKEIITQLSAEYQRTRRAS